MHALTIRTLFSPGLRAAAAFAACLLMLAAPARAQPPEGDDPPREGRRDRERERERGADREGFGRRPREGGPGEAGPGGGPGRPFGPPRDPLREALDSNGDGRLDTDEIAAAAAALLTLDEDGDGTLSGEELRPAMPGPFGPGFGPPGGRPGQGFPGMQGGQRFPGRGGEGPGPFGPGGDRPDGEGPFRGGPRDGEPAGEGPFGPRGGRPDGDREGRQRGPRDGEPSGPGSFGGPFGGQATPERFLDRAMRFDKDGDEKLDRDELTAFAEEMMQGMRALGGQGLPGPRGRAPAGEGRGSED